jgi:hypothetical protein
MRFPFTVEEFLDVFRQYNTAVWPMQIVLNLLALAAIYFSARNKSCSDKIIVITLAFLWLWMGIVYHLIYFSTINNAAIAFGTLFIIQSLVFLYFGVIKKRLRFRFKTDMYGIAGMILIVFALLLYPLLGYLWGHIYPSSPTFGLPCPTTIFTFGILLFAASTISVWVIIIPFLWSLLGFSAAFSLGIKEDTGLLIAGILSTVMILYRNRPFKTSG